MDRASPAVLVRAAGAVVCFLVTTLAHPAVVQEPDPTYATPSPTYLDPRLTGVTPINTAISHQNEGGPGGGVVRQSIFSTPDPSSWRPMSFSTLFSEGWDEAWVPAPNGSGGASRQAWIDAPFVTLPRVYFFTFAQGFNQAPRGNAYLGAYTLATPFNRRLDLILNVPFVLRNNVASGLPVIDPTGQTTAPRSHTGFGDISFTPRVLLHETQDFSLTAEFAISTPTGTRPLAGNRTALTPNLSFWNDIGGRVAIRGGIAVLFPSDGGSDELIGQLAIGQRLTDHDVPWFGDFTYSLAAVVNTPLSNSDMTQFRLTPGIRTHLGHNWYFLTGLPTPVTKQRVADFGMIFWLMKAW